jgi:hypothetical protein
MIVILAAYLFLLVMVCLGYEWIASAEETPLRRNHE